jgi:hypothetical protein
VVFVPFLYELRRRKVPVGTQEALALAQALARGLHGSTLQGFYHVARALLVHSEAHLDAFDEAFLEHFRGVAAQGTELKEELWQWLAHAREHRDALPPEEAALLSLLDPEELGRLFEERLREQTERHDGGDYFIGTEGSSPFGHGGAAPGGIRVGGSGGARSAIQVAGERRFRPYRNDLTLDVRQLTVAMRKLRAFAREGGEPELDLEATIDATAKNAGELEVVTRPPRRPNTRVILMMDVGGSMDPYADLVSRLFSAASKATHFKELRSYYFHNCVYGRVYKTARMSETVELRDLFAECGKHYKVILAGDALMAPYELVQRGSALDRVRDHVDGFGWLTRIAEHFPRSVWLNPEPPQTWYGNTIAHIRQVFPMFPLTVEGLGEAVGHLMRGTSVRR